MRYKILVAIGIIFAIIYTVALAVFVATRDPRVNSKYEIFHNGKYEYTNDIFWDSTHSQIKYVNVNGDTVECIGSFSVNKRHRGHIYVHE